MFRKRLKDYEFKGEEFSYGPLESVDDLNTDGTWVVVRHGEDATPEEKMRIKEKLKETNKDNGYIY